MPRIRSYKPLCIFNFIILSIVFIIVATLLKPAVTVLATSISLSPEVPINLTKEKEDMDVDRDGTYYPISL